jgi:hypothetical protein
VCKEKPRFENLLAKEAEVSFLLKLSISRMQFERFIGQKLVGRHQKGLQDQRIGLVGPGRSL